MLLPQSLGFVFVRTKSFIGTNSLYFALTLLSAIKGSQNSGSLVDDDCNENSMESHADNSIATEGRDENSSKKKQSSMTSENSSEEDFDPGQKYS